MTNQATSDNTARDRFGGLIGPDATIAMWFADTYGQSFAVADKSRRDLRAALHAAGYAIVQRGGVRLEMPVDTARGLQRVISVSPHQWAVRFREMVTDAIAAAEQPEPDTDKETANG